MKAKLLLAISMLCLLCAGCATPVPAPEKCVANGGTWDATLRECGVKPTAAY